MSVLSQASHEWASRPPDERYVGLDPMIIQAKHFKEHTRALGVSTRDFEVRPIEGDDHGLALVGKSGQPYIPTNWSFGQIAARAGAPAGYLRDLPAPLVADCINFGLKDRSIDEVGVLLYKNGGPGSLAAMTGPNYGRIWNLDLLQHMRRMFGDGLTGNWRIPGEFGKKIEYTKANTTMFMSDRDMFVFLADEDRRIEIPNRRAGLMGTFARGFFLKNSEVGSATLELWGFLYDYTCCNRNVWGVEGIKKISIRHTSGAPWRWLEQARPALQAYTESSTKTLEAAIKERQTHKLGDKAAVTEFLNKRFTKSQTTSIHLAHETEEGRPIESLWDASVGATAYAKTIDWQDQRVAIERAAGQMLG